MPILGVIASSVAKVSGSYDWIATLVGDNSSLNIRFGSIPTTYKHLELRTSCRINGNVTTTGFNIRFNDDTGNNYNYAYFSGNGSSVTGGSVASGSGIYVDGATVGYSNNTATAIPHGSSIITIYNYNTTAVRKNVNAVGGVYGFTYAGYGAKAGYVGGNWQNTNPITSITLTQSYAFNGSSEFYLYGIKEPA